MKTSDVCAAVCAALMIVMPMSTPVLAQMNSDYPQKHGGATPDNPRAANNPDAVNDTTLHKSAVAYVRLQRLSSSKAVSHSDEAAVVQQAGLEPLAYKHVMMLVQTDKPLRHKFMKFVQQEGGQPSSAMLH